MTRSPDGAGRASEHPPSLRMPMPAPRPSLASPELLVTDAGRLDGPRIRLFTPSPRWGASRRRELLLSAVLAAIVAHLGVAGAVLEAPRLMPHARHPPPPPPPEAEIVMVKRDTPTVGGTPPVPPKPAPSPQPQKAATGGGAPDRLQAPQGVAVASSQAPPAAGQGTQDTRAPQAASSRPRSDASPVRVNLDVDGEPGWGLVDPRTLPASPDDRYVNKPAAYPRPAAMRGEEGVVYLRTVIAPDGHAEQVEIEQSSGYRDLDDAARNAIAKWHFRPAVRGGAAVESEMHEAYRFSLIR